MNVLAAFISVCWLLVAMYLPATAHAQTTFFPARGVFNGYLQQINILECDNTGNDAVDLSLTLTRNDGIELISHRPINISSYGSSHIILNEIASISDSYGVYTLSIASGQELRGDRVNCRTAFYRVAAPGRGKVFEYAYVLPVESPRFGTSGGVYNSFNPAGMQRPPTLNWLSIVNFDSQAISLTVEIYNGDGEYSDSKRINSLAPGARQDIALGHEFGQVTGIYRIVPDNHQQLYDAFLVRYGPDELSGFRFAFALRSYQGACSGAPLQASTMGNGLTDNWLEIANLTEEDIDISVQVTNRLGQIVYQKNDIVPLYAQKHVYLSSLIDPVRSGNVGAARVTCSDPSDRILVQSAFYGRSTNSAAIEWSYATQLRGSTMVTKDSEFFVPVNTFTGFANWIKLADFSGYPTNLQFETFSIDGRRVATGNPELGARATLDLGAHEQVGGDFVGLLLIRSGSSHAAFSGEALRVQSKVNGEIGTIMLVPGIIQQRGLSGGSQPGFFGNPQSLTPYRNKLTDEEIRHLYARAAFGADKNQLVFARANGLFGAVADLTTLKDASAIEAEAMALARQTVNGLIGYSNIGVKRSWLHLMVNTPNPLKERMALFWHDLLATSCASSTGEEKDHCFQHREMLRNSGFGNFRTLLKVSSQNYLMLFWLNGYLNGKLAPDENYARELWELFTMGEKSKHRGRYPLYTELDIAASARAFTGCWVSTLPENDFRTTLGQCPTPSNWNSMPTAAKNRRDNGVKTLWTGTPFEASGNYYAEDIIDLTLDRRRESAEFLATRLFIAFIHDHPNSETIQQLADLIRRNNWEVLPVLRILLTSEAMFSVDARKSRFRNPISYMVGIQRMTGLRMTSYSFGEAMRASGLELLNPPDVNGWPLSKPGDDAKSAYYFGWPASYANFAQLLLGNPASGTNVVTQLRSILPQVDATAEQAVDAFAAALDVRLSASERESLIFYMNHQRDSNGTSSSYTQKNFNPSASGTSGDRYVRTKLAGLLWILSQHEQFLLE